MLEVLISLFFVLLIEWLVTALIVKLITLCFGLTFNLAIATGVWLIMILLRFGISGWLEND